MSEVEKLWHTLAPKFGNNKQWNDLSPEAQHTFIYGINMILQAVHSG